MDTKSLRHLNELRKGRKAAIVVKNLTEGSNTIVEEGSNVRGELGEAVAKALRSGKSFATSIDGSEYFLNTYLPPARLVVIGAAHISQALAPIARIAGFDMEVIDPRTAFATPERFRDSRIFADWPEEVFRERPLDPYCALAAVTHDPKIDDFPLQNALEAGCFYVGALGSRKTNAKRIERLSGNGVSEEQLARIHAPIGLDIGASSPQEIAVAIMAEVIQALRSRGV